MTIELTDAQLVERCRAGSQEAWNETVERFSRCVLHRRAVPASGERRRGRLQDVFARTFERLSSLRDDTAIRPWLAQLTRNACVDRLALPHARAAHRGAARGRGRRRDRASRRSARRP